jgi:predicted metal-dependent peptidase
MNDQRKGFDEALKAMILSTSPYHKDYCFYAHMISQCRLIFDENMPAPAAVNFMHDHFNLFIKPSEFNEWPLEHRIGVLKHEMFHILYNHIQRSKQYDHKGFNYAADCALNQHIDESHLPSGCILPNNFPSKTGTVPPGMTAEQYYEMIDFNNNPDDSYGSQSGMGNPSDSHDKWDESQGHEAVQKDIAKNMAQQSQKQTTKANGNTPSEYSEWMEILDTRKEIDWRQLLRRIVGNKRANSRRTLMRRDRRQPHLPQIKGRTKDRVFELAVISDVSGSVSNEALLAMWAEIRNICDITGTPVKLVQVDTSPSPPEELSKNTRSIERKASGGTYLSPAITTLKEHHINYDCLVVSTDGYLDSSDIIPFAELNKRVLWLIEANGQVIPEMNKGRMQAIKLKDN